MNELFDKLLEEYVNCKSSDKIEKLIQKIAKNKGTYRDLYEYASELGDELGFLLKDNLQAVDYVLDREQIEERAKGIVSLLREYHSDIEDEAEIVQTTINEGMGVHLKPQRAKFDEYRARKLAEEADINSLQKAVENFGMKTVDDTVHDNAEFISNAGFRLKIVREYDNVGVHTQRNVQGSQKWKKKCEWCLEREGVFDYLKVRRTGNKVWQRHEGCGCSIEYYNDKGQRETVNNFVESSKRDLSRRVEYPLEKRDINDNILLKYKGIMDVTEEYEKQGKPGEGVLSYEKGADKKDIETGRWYFNKYGGNVIILEELHKNNQKNPDSLINGIYTEFKAPEKIARIDDRLRYANKQIRAAHTRENLIGEKAKVIVNISKIDGKEDEIVNETVKCFVKRIYCPADLIVRKKDNTVIVVRKK